MKIVVRPDQWTTQPWKNGGGITHEVYREPAEGPFELRLSVAEVASDGPFSIFDDVDRTIVLLEGAGFELRSAEERVTVTERGRSFEFFGEEPFHCRLLNGPVRDFNLMVRRRRLPNRRTLVVLLEPGAVDGEPLPAHAVVISTQPLKIEGEAWVCGIP